MDTAVNPTLSFPTGGEDPGASLTFASGSWSDNQTYVASYTVTDANQELATIDVSVSGAQDAIGNAMSTRLEPDVFAIDTLNDAPIGGNLTQTVSYTESDTNVDLSPTAITVGDADAGEQLTATLTLADTATGSLSGCRAPARSAGPIAGVPPGSGADGPRQRMVSVARCNPAYGGALHRGGAGVNGFGPRRIAAGRRSSILWFGRRRGGHGRDGVGSVDFALPPGFGRKKRRSGGTA